MKSPKKEKKVVGLRNLGNTCFMNAVLQSLSNIDEFCLYFKRLPSLENVKNGAVGGRKVYHSSRSMREINDELMAEELRKVLISLRDQDEAKSAAAISPESLFLVIWKVVPRFRGYQQQDAHEFLLYMLSRVHTELLHLLPDPKGTLKDNLYVSLGHSIVTSVFGGVLQSEQDAHEFLLYMLSRVHTELLHLLPDPKGTLKDNLYVSLGHSIVTSVFGGVLQSEVRCLNCSMESKMNDPFLDLSLEIPDKYLQQTSYRKLHKDKEALTAQLDEAQKAPPCHIFDCLTNFTEVEEFAESELYFCNHCKGKQRSTKRFWIRRWNNTFRTKVDTSISFPVTSLDMSKFVLSDLPDTRLSSNGSNLYDLAAVIVHHGSGTLYILFALNDGQWFHFNDSSVRPTQPDVVAKCKPYIMFYIRREFRLPIVSS
ncbi:hypothetical protein LSTR_LSTR005344 [Laodelphax striatellus]|uniref:ubiquitinyl hydrolase 1 n=1 Tax=Laodelphax striatellus TaxID=195883 RepID=A0A482WV37_LAOST|nr:hypothetical protein LSTR_LSTR005344 [Laodelphax striatellus]